MEKLRKISLDDIRNAAYAIQGEIERTRVSKIRTFSNPDSELWLKHENEQRTGSFKIRGALNCMLKLSEADRKKGVIAASAGNHAQGVALASKILGIECHIVMPVTTPLIKIANTKSHGANVILHGDYYNDAYEHACLISKEKGYVFVHPFHNSDVVAGAGTIGIEILEDLPDVDTVIIPIGGGGLISGVAQALKELSPKVRIIGVVSDQSASLWYRKRGEPAPDFTSKKRISTIAEGIAVKYPSDSLFNDYINPLVDEIIMVSDDEISYAITFLIEQKKTVAEGAGAAGLAAALSGRIKLGKKNCVVMCGGNIDISVMARVIERGLRREHRWCRLAVVVDDLPGHLSRLTNLFADHRANILEVYHDRVSNDLGLRETRIDFLLETASPDHVTALEEEVRKLGFRVVTSTR